MNFANASSIHMPRFEDGVSPNFVFKNTTKICVFCLSATGHVVFKSRARLATNVVTWYSDYLQHICCFGHLCRFGPRSIQEPDP